MNLFEKFLSLVLPHFDIKKTIDGQEVVYLRRFFLFKSRWGNIYLHHILRSDDDPDPHDHPWDFTSLILRGGYVDESYRWLNAGQCTVDITTPPSSLRVVTPLEKGQRFGPVLQEVKPFTVQRRKAEHIHRVILDTRCTGKDLHHGQSWCGETTPAWTLVFTGPYRRDWNFVTKQGFVPWKKYLNIPEDVTYGGN